MNLTDLLVIYFTVGAPFAVYYFLRNRRDDKSVSFWLKNFLVFLFWLPFAPMFFLGNKHFQKIFTLNLLKDILVKDSSQEISQYQKQIENILLKSDLEISTFDYREIVERYTGLTLASQIEVGNSEAEVFRIAENENIKLGSICLQRRNRNKLVRHQTEARRDFLQIIEQLTDSISDTESLQKATIGIVKILNDDATRKSLEKMFAEKMQIGNPESVKYSEKDLWKPQEQQPLRSETISTRL